MFWLHQYAFYLDNQISLLREERKLTNLRTEQAEDVIECLSKNKIDMEYVNAEQVNLILIN